MATIVIDPGHGGTGSIGSGNDSPVVQAKIRIGGPCQDHP